MVLGYGFKEYYNIGDTIPIRYSGERFNGKVVGFYDKDLVFDEFSHCDSYSTVIIPYMDNLESHTKLLGYPDVVQNSMEEECVEVTRDFDMEAVKASPKKYKEEIKKAAENWILLFQMDTVETDDYELMFGDSGHIYFWIKKEDLKNKSFDNVWLILQSC